MTWVIFPPQKTILENQFKHIMLKKLTVTLLAAAINTVCFAQQTKTYAERLGFPKGAKVLIIHVDDTGMSHDSDMGFERASTEGIANSTSVMMPCPWVPEIVKYIKEHPATDAGLHLTLTSEWNVYKWSPVADRSSVPGLIDKNGYFYADVPHVFFSAKPEEVDREIRAQLDLALKMGLTPTHLDTHMGTVFAKPAYLEKYVKLGIEKQIPVMIPAGDATFYLTESKKAAIEALKKQGKYQENMTVAAAPELAYAKKYGEMAWNGGLPVLDDLVAVSYDWETPDIAHKTDKELQTWYTDHYIESLNHLTPGLTMVICHATDPTETFKYICNESQKRKGDLLAMTDPRFKKYLKDNGFILTTWREVMERRKKVVE